MKTTSISIAEYNNAQGKSVKEICDCLESNINIYLNNSKSKIWHGSPVWFLNDNPIVAYSVRKDNRVSLMFFSGQSFDDVELISEGKFKAAEIFYKDIKDIDEPKLKVWLEKAKIIQWDYKNIVKRKGVLERLSV